MGGERYANGVTGVNPSHGSLLAEICPLPGVAEPHTYRRGSAYAVGGRRRDSSGYIWCGGFGWNAPMVGA